MKVLIIDDEEMIRSLAQRILHRAGHEVLLAEDGRTGLELFSSKPGDIDLVLLDLTLQGTPGMETLARIRAIVNDVPCIISSGNPPEPGLVPAELDHHITFLQKPYRASQLTDVVNSFDRVEQQTD
ncbi:MAG: response regulator [bacterium]